MKTLDKIFKPKTIAVIGASDRKGTVGYSLFKNLIGSDYNGIVYPVNLKRENVQSIRAYPNIKEVPDKIDLAIIATPAKFVPSIVKECGEAGVGGLVIISAGFSEVGEEGKKMTKKIVEYGKKYNMRIVGPNCLGFIKPSIHLNASFASKMALNGNIAFISQSGALCTSTLDWATKNNVGFRYFVSIGSMADVSFADLIDYFGQDPKTSCILVYMESLTNARKFLSAARAFARSKPIIVLKSGRSSEGAKAAMSHTGSLAGNDAVFDAAFERAGVIRVSTIVELFHSAKALAMQPRPKTDRLAIVTNAGGPGVLAVDALIHYEGNLAELSKETIAKLNKYMPAAWSKGNPVDILGDADPDRYKKALEIVLADKNVDAVLVILTPQSMTDPGAVAKKLAKMPNKENKPILASWMGGNDVLPGRAILEKGNIPAYRTPEDAIRCFLNIYNYTRNLESLYETPSTIPHAFKPNTKASKKIISDIIKTGRGSLTEAEAKQILKNYEIPVVNNSIAKSAKEAGQFAQKIGFPVAMKILSPDIIHKTDVGGVALNINSRREAENAYGQIIESAKKHKPEADIHGVFMEAMTKKKYELLIGCKKDPIFGPAIVFGMGGVAVEIFKDTKVGLPPLNMGLAFKLIAKTKIYNLLKGYRGMPGADIQAIQFLLYKFAYLLTDFPEIKELDINPFGIDENGGIVLDAKIILDKDLFGKEIKPYSHLVISPYPKEYNASFKMKNGKLAKFRAIRPEDEKLEKGLFDTFSKETHKHRFFEVIKDIDHNLLTRFTQIDYDREIAIIALVKEKGEERMAGVVRLISDPSNEKAEFAVAIGDPWHFQGLGKRLTDYILKIAKGRGVKQVWARYLNSNKPMHAIFEKKGFKFYGKGKIIKAELDF